MPMPDYVRDLRALVGHQRLLLVGAAAVIRDDAGRILLIRRRDNGQWALPAGIMELDEAIADTVVREVREETGLTVEPVRLIGVYTDPALQNFTYPHGDQVRLVNATFECRIVGGQPQPDGDEVTEVAFYPPASLPDLPPAHRLRVQDALDQRSEAYFR